MNDKTKWLKRTSLLALDNATNKGRPALKLMRYSTGSVFHSCDSEVQEISEWLDSKLVSREGKRVYKGWGGWWLFDAEIQAALMDLEKRRAAFEESMNEEFTKITKKAKRVDGSNFKDLLKTKGTT